METFYERRLLGPLLDWAMGGTETLRADLLSPLKGRVLEIGFGTGLNFPYYDAANVELVAVEPSHALAARARHRMQDWGTAEILEVGVGREALPLPSASFDAVVLTFVLCSVPEVDLAIQEAKRLLKPAGQIVLAEHVADPGPFWGGSQKLVGPLWSQCFGGCQLRRSPIAALDTAGFDTSHLTRTVLPFPRIVSEGLIGTASLR